MQFLMFSFIESNAVVITGNLVHNKIEHLLFSRIGHLMNDFEL